MPIANKYYESLVMADFVSEYLGGYTVLNADVNFGEGLLPPPLARKSARHSRRGAGCKKYDKSIIPRPCL
jgi:hypothetical protein